MLILSGCADKQINPYEEETSFYSIYGAIDLHSSRNVIRVRDLNVFHTDSNSIDLDATVTFYDLKNGTSQVLRDSIIQYPENYTHNFLLNKNLLPDSPYKVEVERSDGASISSMFTTPSVTETEVSSAFENINCYTPIKLVFKNVLPDDQVRIEFGVSYQ